MAQYFLIGFVIAGIPVAVALLLSARRARKSPFDIPPVKLPEPAPELLGTEVARAAPAEPAKEGA